MSCPNLTHSALAVNQTDEQIRYKIIQYYIMQIAIPTVCAFGTLGNILNAVVLTRDQLHRVLTKMEKSAHLGLIALALSDLLFCILVLLITTLPSENRYRSHNMMLYFDFVGAPFISIFILTSTWLIVCMAGERYLAVCHPFKARKVISIKKSKLTILLIFVLCSLFSIPLFLEKHIVSYQCPPDNQTWYEIKKRVEFTDHLHNVRRLTWSIIADFIPCGSLVFFNICLIVHIQKAKKIRKTMAAHSVNGTNPKQMEVHKSGRTDIRDKNSNTGQCRKCRDTTSLLKPQDTVATGDRYKRMTVTYHTPVKCTCDRQMSLSASQNNPGSMKNRSHDSALNSVTATLMSIVLLFLILVSPSEILKFAACSNRKDCQTNITFLTIRNITNFMQSINFSVNFVLYCAISQPFRETLRGVLCFWQTDNNLSTTAVVMKPYPRTLQSTSHSQS